MYMATPHKVTVDQDSYIGLLITGLILGTWLLSLMILLPADIASLPISWLVLDILGRTFLHTGLFVIAHDAMHGNLIPINKQINHQIGRLCVGLFAFLSYDICCSNHKRHHSHPAQIGDPDFHDGIHQHPVFWYIRFISAYLNIRLMALFLCLWGAIFSGLHYFCNISPLTISLFWVLPLILSSIQLFFFGTYLPHRNGSQPLNLSFRSYPSFYVTCCSLLSCYHFGYYHQEHHASPRTPWYRLPDVHILDDNPVL